ncbi:hypothetical protein CR513_28941, partial [Mucuna pruriens]
MDENNSASYASSDLGRDYSGSPKLVQALRVPSTRLCRLYRSITFDSLRLRLRTCTPLNRLDAILRNQIAGASLRSEAGLTPEVQSWLAALSQCWPARLALLHSWAKSNTNLHSWAEYYETRNKCTKEKLQMDITSPPLGKKAIGCKLLNLCNVLDKSIGKLYHGYRQLGGFLA